MWLIFIYLDLNLGNFSEAIRKCQDDTVVKVPLTQALYSYALACVRRQDEAIVLAEQVASANIYDEAVVSTVSHTYKVCKADHQLVSLYEKVLSMIPNSEKFAVELFVCYNRINEPKKMQLLAQKIYKFTGQQCYVYWIVTSMLLQNDLIPAMLVVAEKMLMKVFDDSCSYIPGTEEILLFVEVMCRQHKFREALKIVDSLLTRQLGPALNDNDDFVKNANKVTLCTRFPLVQVIDAEVRTANVVKSLQLMKCRADLLQESIGHPCSDVNYNTDRDMLLDQLKEILCYYPDQYDTHRLLLKLLQDTQSKAPLIEHVQYLCNYINKFPQLRGPRLAEIECRHIIGNHDVFNLVQEYLLKFGDKQCCFSDIRDLVTEILSQESNMASVSFTSFVEWIRQQLSSVQQQLSTLEDEVLSSFINIVDPASDVNCGHDHAEAIFDAQSDKSNDKSTKNKKKNRQVASSSASSTTPDYILPQSELEEFIQRPDSKKDNLRIRALSLTTRYCKYLQVLCHCYYFKQVKNLSTQTFVSSISMEEVIQVHTVCRRLCERLPNLGGAREVQPSDELLLVMSVHLRQGYAHSYRLRCCKQYIWALRWALLLKYAISCSPYAYSFNLEILEPYRALVLADAARQSFDRMDIKYIQYDTLSYLIIPPLYEGGLIAEVIAQSESVIRFHSSARRETLDMMGARAFKSCSYVKALELKRFINLCQSSTQLALSRAELTVLELISTSRSSTTDSVLRQLLGDRVNKLDSRSTDDSLSDNMDYSLLVRVDITKAQEITEKDLRSNAYRYRILHANSLVKLLAALVDDDSDIVMSMASVLFKNNDYGDIHSKLDYYPWRQYTYSLLTASPKLYDFGDELKKLQYNFVSLCVRILKCTKETESGEGLALETTQWTNQFSSLIDFLLQEEVQFMDLSESNGSLLNPEWLLSVCQLVTGFSSWAPLVLHHLRLSSEAAPNFQLIIDQVLSVLGESLSLLFKRTL